MHFATIPQAVSALQEGRMIVVVDDEDRENEGDLVMAAQFATPDAVNFMITKGKGLLCAPLSRSRMESLEIPPMVTDNTDPHQTAFGVSVDAVGTTTGIAAQERSRTLAVLSDGEAGPDALRRPGHVFPLMARDGGVLERRGHTEASIDLMHLAGLAPAAAICEIIADDGTMARLPELFSFAEKHGLLVMTIAELVRHRRATEPLVDVVATFDAPTRYGHFLGVSFRDIATGETHVALVAGDVEGADGVLVRVHSECLTGDALGSLRCDCGDQLRESLHQIGKADAGVLIYLRQEGRGIGLHHKLRAYELQDGGLDTYEANVALGFAPDLREYHVAAAMLRHLGVTSVRLLTNNPEKIAGLAAHGVDVVERLPLEVAACMENEAYLSAKRERFGHLLTRASAERGWFSCR